MSRLLHILILACFASTSSWVVAPTLGCRQVVALRSPLGSVCMQEEPAAAAEAVAAPEAGDASMDDFTEDLLDALAFDETPLSAPMTTTTWSKAEGESATLEPREGYMNALTVDAARAKYKLHENDTGSAQVQVAVLTARIAYLTKHMQQNKKDNASLRGLQQMVTRRRKLLEYLLREDLPEFKRLTSELGIRAKQMLKPKLSGARGRRV